ncbi:MAG: hypothetical protein PHN88_04680 [Ignavibacteria bacterium]|nr:hypothetical protein [Ignavibacteria bacterium]
MKIIKLFASLVDGSGIYLEDSIEIHKQILELFEGEVEDYVLVGNGKTTCLLLLGDDTGAPLIGIYGEFTHMGKNYIINIPNDNTPVTIKILLDYYDRGLCEKIALRNLEATFKANNITILNVVDEEYKWVSNCSFEVKEHKRADSKTDKIVEVFKEDGNHIYRS